MSATRKAMEAEMLIRLKLAVIEIQKGNYGEVEKQMAHVVSLIYVCRKEVPNE